MRPSRIFLIVIGALALQGCASAGKDIHFRSRLPTQEVPLFFFAEENGAFGLDSDFENQRYTRQPTNNLVNNYHVASPSAYFPDEERGLSGVDLSATYRNRSNPNFTWKAGLSFDFAEVQVDPSAVLGLGETWFVNVNAGVYKTAAFVSTGSGNCFPCFGGSAEAELKESAIGTTQSGNERKMGFQVTHLWHRTHALTLSTQWMDYRYEASVTKNGSPDLSFDERSFAAGHGLGYAYVLDSGHGVLAATADAIEFHVLDRTIRETVVGLRWSLYFPH